MLDKPKDFICLKTSHLGFELLSNRTGIRWHSVNTLEEIRDLLISLREEVHCFIRLDFINDQTLLGFLSWRLINPRIKFIFLAQVIDKSAHKFASTLAGVTLLRESEGALEIVLERYIQGFDVRSRKQERLSVHAPVMLKKSTIADSSPIGTGVQFLREGHLQDFSQGGAQVLVSKGPLLVRDFVNLMYREESGKWVSVECQVRWIESHRGAEQIIGVQFLAVSA